MKNVKEILEKVYVNKNLRRSIVPLFIGNPGLGKTVLIEEFAKEKGVQLVELITSQMSPFEVSGIAMPVKETGLMTYFNFDKLENLKDGDILFFDELLNGNPIVLNACLTILEQRRFISGKPLPDIMIVAAANPQGMSPLTPQIKERFIWYNVKFDASMWANYMIKKYQISTKIRNKLVSLINGESFTSNNFYTPRSIDKAVNMIIYDVPTPYADTIKPVLSELIENPFEQSIKLSKTRTLAPKEMISWLELIRFKLKIVVEKPVEDPFVLPKKWYVKATVDNRDVLREWRKESYHNWNDHLGVSSDKIWIDVKNISQIDGFTEITFEQFQLYVLNK